MNKKVKVKYISYYTSEEYTLEELKNEYRDRFESDAAFGYFLRKQFRRVEMEVEDA